MLDRERQISDLESQVQVARDNVSRLETEQHDLVKKVSRQSVGDLWVCSARLDCYIRLKLERELLLLSNNCPGRRYPDFISSFLFQQHHTVVVRLS